jgi:ATP-binding cassette subfamily B multidrug efflux pump
MVIGRGGNGQQSIQHLSIQGMEGMGLLLGHGGSMAETKSLCLGWPSWCSVPLAAFRLDLIRRYLRPHRTVVLQGAAALVVVNLLSVTIPLLVRRVVDDLQDGFALGDVLGQAGLIVALATLMGGVRLLSRLLVFGVGRQVEADLKQQIFDHLLRQEPGWVQSTGSGEVISRATSDVENVRRLLGFAVLSLTNTALAYGLTLPAMLAIDPWLSLAAIGLYPLMLSAVRLFGGRMMRQQRRQQEALASLSDLIQEDLSGIGAIKIYGQEATEQQAFAGRNRLYRDAALGLARTRSTLFPLLEGISSVSLLLLLALGSGQLESGRLSIGDLVALILYVERLVFPTALLGFTLNTFQTGQVSLERIEQLLQRQPRIVSPPQPQPPARAGRGGIEARGLTVRYADAPRPALVDVSFQVEPGELVAVVGPVGCGKTTLARALGRMVEVEPGQLWLDGVDITRLELAELRRRVALVPQEGFLFTATLADNLRYGAPAAALEQVEQCAREARLEADVKGFPDGYQTLVGERGITLSGGQRQRTALGRALLVDAPLLVLDDALASVDNTTAAEILRNVRSQQNRTVLMISHQLSAAAACDRVLVLEEGRLVQEGHHRTLLEQPGTYRRLWERQQAAEQLQAAGSSAPVNRC